jgi:ADP-dependent NAD(P)H-hydrate dehydratase / NAD(P)H-hydrate epimerase
MMKYVSVAEMQAIEREANLSGLSYARMMENAGRGLAEVVLDEYGYLAEGGALGLVGSGNNGGDTLVALAYLAEEGWNASAAILRPRPQDDGLVTRLQAAGGRVLWLDKLFDRQALVQLLDSHDLLLDGVLGTGVRLPLKDEIAQALGFIRQRLETMDNPPVVVAVDCPSGVDCDRGEVAPECLPAELTVTMAAIKQGLLKFPAYHLVGELRVVGIGLEQGGEGLQAWVNVRCILPDLEWIRTLLPRRPLDAHKGTFGTALIAAGSTSYTGAALLAGMAAYRVGTGLVTLAVPEPLHAALAGGFPEATWVLLPQQDGVIAAQAEAALRPHLGKVTALLVGPGIGLEPTTGEFLGRLLGRTGAELPPIVIDADGLKLLRQLPDWARRLPSPAVLTPHPGEMSVLTGLPKEQIQADRLGLAQRCSQEWGHVVVLKGAFTVVAAPEGDSAIIPVATPALARAGTGDVLAGLIVGLRAQGVQAFEAAVAGAWIHAYAGLQAVEQVGNPASVLAGDVLKAAVSVITDLLN